jgi:hypothetical protein
MGRARGARAASSAPCEGEVAVHSMRLCACERHLKVALVLCALWCQCQPQLSATVAIDAVGAVARRSGCAARVRGLLVHAVRQSVIDVELGGELIPRAWSRR